ncbi:MAG: DUF6090 family protein [Bacteroidales bacterium]|nr:DUF6090 family protein [Bacteroidales bacterium]
MADDNRPIKYLRYAVGEILLVVIGILIALSINNWNQQRIKERNAVLLSNRLFVEIRKNKKELGEQIMRITDLQTEAKTLLMLFGPDYEQQNTRLLDSLIYGIISTPLFNSNSPTLDEALNTGQISLLQSDSLRAMLYDIPKKIHRINNYEDEMTRDIEYNIMPYLYNKISFRQMDEEFSDNFDVNERSKLSHFDNRTILLERKFENMVDNKYFLLETLLMGYEELLKLYDETLHFFEKSSGS